MSLEQKLISSIASSRESFDKLSPYLEDYEWSGLGAVIYSSIADYYETDVEAVAVDWELVKPSIEKELGPKKEPIITEYLSTLPESTSLPNVLKLFQEAKKERIGFSLMQALARKADEEVKQLMEQYLELQIEEQQEELYNASTIEELSEHFLGKNLITIYPRAISDKLGGGLPRQSQVCIFARPDVGKSVAAINMAVGAAQDGFKVLYIGNEDAPPKMMYRFLTRFCRVTEAEINLDKEKYYNMAIENGYGNLFFVPMHPGTYKEIRKRIEQVRPDVVIIDQIRNCKFSKDGLTINLEEGCRATRNLAKEFNLLMVVVTQAGDSAHNKLFLEYTDVDYSNTGVAAAQDLMIGIGQNKELKDKNQVVLNFPKNKYGVIKPITASIEYHINRILA